MIFSSKADGMLKKLRTGLMPISFQEMEPELAKKKTGAGQQKTNSSTLSTGKVPNHLQTTYAPVPAEVQQFCGAGARAGGAEIIWGPGAGAENKF